VYGFAEGDPVNFDDPFGLCEDPKDRLCALFEASMTLLGGTAGFVAGGGAGLMQIAFTGGLATPAAITTAATGTALGTALGRETGRRLSNVLFSKNDREFRGGKRSTRDADYERLLRERRPNREQRTRIHEEIGKRKQGRKNLDPDELQDVFDDIIPKKSQP
jgi:hypothetical protein